MKNIFIYSENNFFLNSISDVFKHKFKTCCIIAADYEIEKVKNNFKDNKVFSLKDFEKARSDQILHSNKNFIDRDFLKENEDIEILAYKMLDFYNPGGCNFSFVEARKAYYEALNFSMNLIEKYKPDILFMTNTPHSFMGVIFSRLCEKRKIQFVFKRETTIPGLFYFQNNIFSKILPQTTENHDDYFANEIFLELQDYYNRVLKKDTKYIKNIFKKSRSRFLLNSYLLKLNFLNINFIFFCIGNFSYRLLSESARIFFRFFKHLLKKNPLWLNPFSITEDFFKIRNKKFFESDHNSFRLMFNLFMGDLRKFRLLQSYRSIVSKISKGEKYIYFPLHYQPEATTYPFGDCFIDQINAIKIISSVLPSDMKIYVKEHPDTFNIGRDGWVIGDYSRDANYYSDLIKINNVKLISMDLESLELADKSMGLATINGAAGLEYAINKKPVAFFGNSWLDRCPGIIHCRKMIDAKIFINECINPKKIIKDDEIVLFFKEWSNLLFSYKNINANSNKIKYIKNLFLNIISS